MAICNGRVSNAIRDSVEIFECGNILPPVSDFRLLDYDIV